MLGNWTPRRIKKQAHLNAFEVHKERLKSFAFLLCALHTSHGVVRCFGVTQPKRSKCSRLCNRIQVWPSAVYVSSTCCASRPVWLLQLIATHRFVFQFSELTELANCRGTKTVDSLHADSQFEKNDFVIRSAYEKIIIEVLTLAKRKKAPWVIKKIRLVRLIEPRRLYPTVRSHQGGWKTRSVLYFAQF